jgi:hypothetical protein
VHGRDGCTKGFLLALEDRQSYLELSCSPEMSERNTNDTTQRIAMAMNAVHDFVTARAASIPTAASNMTATIIYLTGDCFMFAILDCLLSNVKGIT